MHFWITSINLPHIPLLFLVNGFVGSPGGNSLGKIIPPKSPPAPVSAGVSDSQENELCVAITQSKGMTVVSVSTPASRGCVASCHIITRLLCFTAVDDQSGFPQFSYLVKHSATSSFAVQEHKGDSRHSWGKKKVEFVPDVLAEKNNLMSHQVWSQTYKIWGLVYYFNVKEFWFPSKVPDVLLASTLFRSRTEQSVYFQKQKHVSLLAQLQISKKCCFWYLILNSGAVVTLGSIPALGLSFN